MVSRVYVEKKPGFDGEAKQLKEELRSLLGVGALENLRMVNRYDVEGISDELFAQCVPTVFSEPQSDIATLEMPEANGVAVFAVEYLPGQFDQRADSASECIQLISQGERPEVRSAKVYMLEGALSDEDVAAIKHYVINPIEAREASLDVRETLHLEQPVPGMVETVDGFLELDEAGLAAFIADRGLAMDLADIAFCQQYFAEEGRNPTITEIKMIDTYWSDHCRHTTFGTVLDNVAVEDEAVQAAFEKYLEMRHELGRDEKPVCLMDMGTIGARWLKAKGVLTGLDESEEINACTVKCKVDVDGEEQDWLYLFKNETHNHPTEIEPFGGAATCVGGAIRDPLSGRSYVYQAMRVTGAADPLVPVSETLPGKLPQRKLVTTAAAGYSSYGNQIGLATGQVNELYHPGYAAKRMEIGAVVGATPADHVRRETPAPGDVVVLLGGRTGRDGIGGATGSSKAHKLESLESCGAEVQKGNAPVERKIQRLFRRGDACKLIKRCNDFGAGTVLMPFGGSRQLTPAMAMVAKLPVFGETTTVSGMAWGFNPYLTEANQFTGSYIAVVESVARLVAAGFFHKDMYLTFQEYFEKLRDEPERWGKPAAAVLGALMAQVDLGIGSIGGKDSMSGSFEQLDVPPTLVSFATAIGSVDRATSPEFKQAGSRVVRIAPASYDGVTPDAAGLVEAFELVERLIGDGAALAVSTPGYGATAEALFKMSVGNGIGVKLTDSVTADELFAPSYGSFLVELAPCVELPHASDVVRVDEVGETTEAYEFAACGEVIDLVGLQEAWEGHLESVFPYRAEGDAVETVSFTSAAPLVYNGTIARPRVIIPVFPGNNCEYDSARAFEQAGAVAETLIINNLTPDKVAESTEALVKAIENSQIIMIPGGFSGGDEPDGSAKFITAFFRAPAVTEAVRDLLQNRDGLMLGICNGFQALVKLGLVPFGDIRPMDEECPTLTFNTIGRHQSRLVRTRVASNLSPWLSRCEVGDIHTVPVSHGEGRFVASPELAAQLAANGQIATQYVDEQGVPSMSLDVNPNGSVLAIEGITSPDGRILGKMGHSERRGYGLYQNVPGDRYQQLFEGGVGYFTD